MAPTQTSTRTPDFTGYATRFDRVCSDGRTIKHGAFLHQDGQQVPLVWQHQHDNPENVLGHAILFHREDGVYTEAYFNDTERGRHAKAMVQHGDIKALSIFANKLKQKGGDVIHGMIGEVSLVYRGANPEAYIEDVNLQHSGDGSDTMVGEAIIYSGEGISLYHADGPSTAQSETSAGETLQDVWNTLTPKQENTVLAIVGEVMTGGTVQHGMDDEGPFLVHAEDGTEIDVTEEVSSLNEEQRTMLNDLVETAKEQAAEDTGSEESKSEATEAEGAKSEGEANANAEGTDETNSDSAANPGSEDSVQHAEESKNSEDENLSHNQEGSDHMSKYSAFENGNGEGTAVSTRKTLSHDDLVSINKAAQKGGSYKEAFEDFVLEHADYGIENIDILFPDARVEQTTPELIARQTEWVTKVLGATKHSPFAKVKTILADLTAEEARAKGYVKGTLKKEEVVVLLARTTSPTTIYKKQKLDRDDILDITDLDVVAWLKWEIRFMLNEELARAILIGDGRVVGNPDKIKDPAGAVDGIGIRSVANDHELYAHPVQLAANVAPDVMIDEITRARTNYRGSGSPTFYTTDSVLTELLLLKDKMGRRLYETEAALAAAIRVKEIVAVEVMEEDATLLGIIVNLIDYTVGSNKGGELTFFEDFDIDFNQHKYLLETRCSGALTKPKSALIIRRNQGTEVTAAAPTFANNVISIPTVTGVDYLIDGNVVTGDVTITSTTDVDAVAKDGYYLAPLSTRHWTFTYTAV